MGIQNKSKQLTAEGARTFEENSSSSSSDRHSKRAFTLIELMVVAVSVGVIAAFAIPSFSKAIERAHEKTAIKDMYLLYSAQEVYKATKGIYYFDTGGTVDYQELNSTLGLQLTNTDFDYKCFRYFLCAGLAASPCDKVACTAERNTAPIYELRISKDSQGQPCCYPPSSGRAPCPTVTQLCW